MGGKQPRPVQRTVPEFVWKNWREQQNSSFTCYCYGVVSYKASHSLQPFSGLLCDLIWFLTFPDSWQITAGTPSSKSREKLGEFFPLILLVKYFSHTPQGSLTCRKILRHGADGFTPPPKEVVLRISIALEKIHLPGPGLIPRTLGPMTSTIATRPPRTTTLPSIQYLCMAGIERGAWQS
jgi:hypothetical protein